MSRRRRGNFQTYYGRRPSRGTSLLKWIIVFLLAVLVVAVAVYFLLQEGLVYDKDGVHLVLPWNREEPVEPSETPTTPSPEPSKPVIIIEPEPEPTLRELAQENLQAVEVTLTGLLSGHAAEQVVTAGGNAALLEMKRPDGTLNYVSSVDLAVSVGASGSDTAVNLIIRDLIEEDIYTIAKVSCFRDHLLGADSAYALLTNSGYRWASNDNLRWTCPAQEGVQDYLTALCVELAQMGFDEILLTDCGYPTADMGPLGWIRKGSAYPAGELDTVLGPFLAKVKEALEPYDTRLSVTAFASELAEETKSTGLNLTNVLESCDHVWVDAEAAAEHDSFADASVPPGEKLVPMSGAAGEKDTPWAIVSKS